MAAAGSATRKGLLRVLPLTGILRYAIPFHRTHHPQDCNGSKSNKAHAHDPVTRQRVPLFHPRRDDWHKHLTWSPDHLHLIGLTPTGRATIQALDLNRAGVVRLRHLLLLDHEHPPKHRS